METKWTKGPWVATPRGTYNDFDGDSSLILGDDCTQRIAIIQNDGTDEDEANAHLIAAAPELYEALYEIIKSGEIPYCQTSPLVIKANAALKKARGES
jgi:hypothetical protein